ncbi:hypothetical protein MTO96_008059 [Rhipicephalus appendiculatus]
MAARISLDGFLSGAGGIGGPPLAWLKAAPDKSQRHQHVLPAILLAVVWSRRSPPLSAQPLHDSADGNARVCGCLSVALVARLMNPNDSCALRFPGQRDLERVKKLL